MINQQKELENYKWKILSFLIKNLIGCWEEQSLLVSTLQYCKAWFLTISTFLKYFLFDVYTKNKLIYILNKKKKIKMASTSENSLRLRLDKRKGTMSEVEAAQFQKQQVGEWLWLILNVKFVSFFFSV